MSVTSRRTFLAGASALAVSAAGGAASAQAGTRLRAFWWGNPDRDKRTKAALDAYKAKAGTEISAEALGWGDYWTKLGTQTAGGNAPDLIQMDYRYIFEYARRNTLLPLDGLAPKPIDLSTFAAAARDCGKVDGKLYGITLGTNSKAMVYDTAMFEKVGVKSLDPNWTWDDMARIAGEISKINPGKYWGSGDNSRWEQGFEHYLNQRGKLLYTARGQGRVHEGRRRRLVRPVGQAAQVGRGRARRDRRDQYRRHRPVRDQPRHGGDELRQLQPGRRLPGHRQVEARNQRVPEREGHGVWPLHQARDDDEHLVEVQGAGGSRPHHQLHGQRAGGREGAEHRARRPAIICRAGAAGVRSSTISARCRWPTSPPSQRSPLPLAAAAAERAPAKSRSCCCASPIPSRSAVRT